MAGNLSFGSVRSRRILVETLCTMMISIALAMSQVSAVSGTTGTPPTPAPAVSAQVTAFSRDMTIFDSDSARGGNRADIPLRGTTTAPNGAAIEARVVRADTGAEVHGWQEIGTATGGAWAGSFTGAQRHTEWLRAQVRVKGSTAPAQATANRFGVGLVFVLEDQSNRHQGLQRSTMDIPEAEFETIGNEHGDFQFIWAGEQGNDPKSIKYIVDGDAHTAAVAAMAATFAKAMPGLKVMGAFITLGGSPIEELLNDAKTKRDFSTARTIADMIHADGSKAGMIWANHYQGMTDDAQGLVAALYGTDLDGNVLPGVDQSAGFPAVTHFGVTMNHVMAEAFPELLDGRMQQITTSLGSWGPSSDPSLISTDMVDPISAARPDFAQFHGYYRVGSRELNTSDPFRRGLHYSKDRDDGFPEVFRLQAVMFLQAGGLLDVPVPRIDHIDWSEDFVEVWSDAGPLTTRARLAGRTTNFPVEPNADPQVEGAAEVLGFMEARTQNSLRTEIVDAQGNPASAGRIRIYPNADRFTTASALYYMLGNKVGVIYAPPTSQVRPWYEADLMAHFAVLYTPLVPNTAIPLQPLPDLDALSAANDISSAGEYAFDTTDQIIDLATYGNNVGGITVAVRAQILPGQRLRLVQEDNTGGLQVNIDKAAGRIYISAKGNGFNDIFVGSSKGTDDLAADANGFSDILMHLNTDPAVQRIEFYVNGVSYDPEDQYFDNTVFRNAVDLRNGRTHRAFGLNGPGVVRYRYWQGPRLGPEIPSQTPLVEIVANPQGRFTAPDGSTYDVYDDGVRR